MPETRRYLGLELAGAKNQKTALAVLEYYPKEKKTFLLDIFDRIGSHDHETGDEALLKIIEEEKAGVAKMGVNVPLQLPPSIKCNKKRCPCSTECTQPSVTWMRNFMKKASRQLKLSARARTFTPYTQRPIELWVRYELIPKLPEALHFEVDETLGGNRAPLAARMHFLKKHLTHLSLVEVWPKLSLALLGSHLKVQKRTLASYRHLEDGANAREEILSALTKKYELFIYERDLHKLSQSLTAFDAFICAFMGFLFDQGECVKPPKGFPVASGWVQYPEVKGSSA